MGGAAGNGATFSRSGAILKPQLVAVAVAAQVVAVALQLHLAAMAVTPVPLLQLDR